MSWSSPQTSSRHCRCRGGTPASRCPLNPARNEPPGFFSPPDPSLDHVARAGSGVLCYRWDVLTVNPALVEADLPSSPDLVALAQAGDREAFGALCRAHGDRLLRQATLLCGDRTLAEDLAQDTLFEAWKSLRRYHGRCRFFTWLCAILLNRHRNYRRQKRLFLASEWSSEEQEGVANILADAPDAGSAPDQATDRAERGAFLLRCVEQLSPKHREVIHLRFYVDQSLDGIAAALGCSVGTVKSRLFHALDRLRAMNSPEGRLREHLRP